MGREISYCTSCGERLLGQEGRGSCEACRKPAAPPAAPVSARRQSSARLRRQPPARPRETTRIRKRGVLPLLIGAAAVLALAVGIAIAAGGSSTPPARPSSVVIVVPPSAAPSPGGASEGQPGPTLDEVLAQIRELRGSDLLFERRDEILRMLKDAGARAGGRLEEVDQIAADYDRKYEEAAARLADFTRSEALRMASKQKFAEALERLDGYPASFRSSKSAESIRVLRRDLERRRAESTATPPAPSSAPPKRVL